VGEVHKRVTVAELAADVGVAGAKLAAAAVTGSSALFAGTVQSVAGTGSDVLQAAAQSRGGRSAWFWALFGAIGLFAVGAALAVWQGIHELLHPTRVSSFALAYGVLAVAFVVELVTFVRGVRSGPRRDNLLMRHDLAISDPLERALLADAAALAGTLVAAVGIALHQATGSVVPDALASIAIGGLLAVVAGYLTRANHEFMAGERVSYAARHRIGGYIAAYPGVTRVCDVSVTFTGPDEVWVVARVEVEDGLSGRDVEALVVGVERTRVQRSAAIGRVDVVPVGHSRRSDG
jgi:divalent metal cation (Fe/Co/Zn/Cd) transporter